MSLKNRSLVTITTGFSFIDLTFSTTIWRKLLFLHNKKGLEPTAFSRSPKPPAKIIAPVLLFKILFLLPIYKSTHVPGLPQHCRTDYSLKGSYDTSKCVILSTGAPQESLRKVTFNTAVLSGKIMTCSSLGRILKAFSTQPVEA